MARSAGSADDAMVTAARRAIALAYAAGSIAPTPNSRVRWRRAPAGPTHVVRERFDRCICCQRTVVDEHARVERSDQRHGSAVLRVTDGDGSAGSHADFGALFAVELSAIAIDWTTLIVVSALLGGGLTHSTPSVVKCHDAGSA